MQAWCVIQAKTLLSGAGSGHGLPGRWQVEFNFCRMEETELCSKSEPSKWIVDPPAIPFLCSCKPTCVAQIGKHIPKLTIEMFFRIFPVIPIVLQQLLRNPETCQIGSLQAERASCQGIS